MKKIFVRLGLIPETTDQQPLHQSQLWNTEKMARCSTPYTLGLCQFLTQEKSWKTGTTTSPLPTIAALWSVAETISVHR